MDHHDIQEVNPIASILLLSAAFFSRIMGVVTYSGVMTILYDFLGIVSLILIIIINYPKAKEQVVNYIKKKRN